MAATSSVSSLHEGLICSLCHKYFNEPVAIECGHSFCRACIVQHWKKRDIEFSCPRCREIPRKRKFTPSRELENIVEIVKRVKAKTPEGKKVEKVCGLHQEPLKHFCKSEQKLLCDTCVESNDHDATHVLVAVEEAVQDYKNELESQLQGWRDKRETAINFHATEKDKCQIFLRKLDSEKQKVMSEFEEVREFLKQQEQIMLDQLEEFVKEKEKFIAKLSGEICLMDTMIHVLEEKSQHPEKVFLQDIEKNSSRYEVWASQQPDVCSELEEKLYAFSKKYIILKNTLLEFEENLPEQLKVEYVNVSLDPDSAHYQLHVSDDRKTLKWIRNQCAVTGYPQQFSSSHCVLGCEAFTSGRHYWEVNIGKHGNWAVGVARKSVNRKESNSTSPEEGIWALKNDNLTDDDNLNSLKRVGVYLDYEGGRVLFFDAKKEIRIGSYSASFMGKKICPFFFLKGLYKSKGKPWMSLGSKRGAGDSNCIGRPASVTATC